ncbi:MAG: AMP-binding protein [Cytophagales bacterium]
MKDYPWFKNYPDYVPHEIDPDKYESLVHLLDVAFKNFKDDPAYVCMDKELTYNDIDRMSLDFASYLQNECGLKKGDRVAIQMPNLLQYPVVMFGVLRAGLIVVNTNPLYTPREMLHQFNDAGVSAIIVLANFANNLEKIISKTGIKHVITTQIGDFHSFPKKQIINFVVKSIKKMVPSYNLPKAISLNQALIRGAQSTFEKVDIDRNDTAFLQYTGGTTGVSKGAILTHRNIIANLEQNSAWMCKSLEKHEEVVITALPLYHIFSLTVNCFTMIQIGAKNILVTNPRDMKAFIKDLKKYPFTVFTGVNTLFNGLLNQEKFKEINFDSLKIAIGGGMAVQSAVAKRWKEQTGCSLLEGYGLTETSPVLSCNPLDGSDKIGTIGMPFPSTEMKIVDEEGNDLPVGEAGEIVARGPQVMPGYWQKEEETKNTFLPEGWFKTGDIGMMHEDGYFQIVDRKKDMILVSGFNVYPNEIEDVVIEHPKVLEVAAVGVPDEKSTECVKLFVVKKDQSLSRQELIDFCHENLTGYKRPKHIEFRDELPKSNVGKIIRRHLRDEKK